VTTPRRYMPGPAKSARIQKDGETWSLVLVKELRHSPERIWRALTDPAELREWAPFDADGNLGIADYQTNGDCAAKGAMCGR